MTDRPAGGLIAEPAGQRAPGQARGRAGGRVSGDMVAGRVLETATANGDVIRCLEFIPYRLSGAI